MSSPPDRFAGIQTKMDRAEQHIKEFVVRFQAFEKTKPYGVVPETDPQTGDRVYRVTVFHDPPIIWGGLVGDVFHNLRAALDHLVWQLIEVEGNQPEDWTAFPISNSETDYKAAADGKVKGVSQAARSLIDATKPYKGGNDGLWQLHRLDIVDKHRLLVPVIATTGNWIFDPASAFRDYFRAKGITDPPTMPTEVKLIKRPLKDGDVLDNLRILDSSPGTNPHDDPKIMVNIALHEPGIIEFEPIGPTLSQMFELVKGVIEPFRPLLV